MIVSGYQDTMQGLWDEKFVIGPRQIGKTTALVDVIYEKHNGDAMVVVSNQELLDSFIKLYSDRHPGKNLPVVITARSASNRGSGMPIYADLFDHFLPSDRNRLRNHLTAAIRGV